MVCLLLSFINTNAGHPKYDDVDDVRLLQ